MTPTEHDRWRRIKEIFDRAPDAPEADRSAILHRHCQHDAALCVQVENLLRLQDQSNLALDRLQLPRISGPGDGQTHPVRLQPGDTVANRYRIRSFLAAGGMGEVHEAVDTITGQALALKCVRHTALFTPEIRARFLRECALIRRIHHPNVCRVYDVEPAGSGALEQLFLVMELLSGETLAERLTRAGRLTTEEALPIATQLCDGLAAAHAAGVLHRDLKPGNIFLTNDRPVIIDFGLAAAVDHDSSLTSAGAVIGTLAYVAPEQMENRQCSPASDIYSLGVVLYEMLTGVKPHPAKSPFRLAAQKAREAHRTPQAAPSGVPLVWQEVLERCLRANPEERFQSASEIKALLEGGRPSRAFVAAKWRRKLRIPALAALILIGACLGWNYRQHDRAPLPSAAALSQAAPVRGAKLLEQAVSLDPHFLQARAALATAYMETDQLDLARDTGLQATEAASTRWFLGRGERLSLGAANAIVSRNYAAAAGYYQQLAASTTGTPRHNALLALARVDDQLARSPEAVEAIQTVLRENPSNGAARVRYAILLARRRETAKATAEYRIAEQAYQQSGNMEGLCDVLLAHAATLRVTDPKLDRQTAERVLALSQQTGNRYHAIMPKFRLAESTDGEHKYDLAAAIVRDAVEEARRENMQVVAARGLAQLGYTLMMKRRFDLGEPYLRESVQLAERAKSYGVLADSRMKLGEALASSSKSPEALEVMRPSLQWLRQSSAETLPLALIKFGTALGKSEESEKTFLEALDIATRKGQETFQSMALQRLTALYDTSDLR